MSALADPVVLALLAGVVVGVGLVVATVLRLGADRTPVAHVTQTRPDPRAQRLDDAVASSPVLQRALEVTANLAERRGALGSVERSLRAADVPVRPAELILANLCLAVLAPILVVALLGSVPKAIFALVVGAAGPSMVLRFMVKRRRKRFANQLPDALTTLAGSLRAGRSVGQAMEALSRELGDPIGRELRKIVAEIRLGRPLQEALTEAADRIDSADFRWAVLAMQIQSEVGGNLAELLDGVAETMRQRARMKGEIKALTAEGRASAMMLVVMVPALGLVMWVMNPGYMAPMFSTTAGHIMLGISSIMVGGGYFWMNSMVKIDV
jgi:tight adherence protein B